MLLANMPQAIEQRAWADNVDERATELPLIGADHFAAKLLVQRLLAVANGKNG
jgi:hypothetical protein